MHYCRILYFYITDMTALENMLFWRLTRIFILASELHCHSWWSECSVWTDYWEIKQSCSINDPYSNLLILGKQNWNIRSVCVSSLVSPFEIHKMINLPASVKFFKNKLKNRETDKSYFHLPHQAKRNNKLTKNFLSCLMAS